MPIIRAFHGIRIQMFWSDHASPYFHALYAERKMLTLDVLEGEILF